MPPAYNMRVAYLGCMYGICWIEGLKGGTVSKSWTPTEKIHWVIMQHNNYANKEEKLKKKLWQLFAIRRGFQIAQSYKFHSDCKFVTIQSHPAWMIYILFLQTLPNIIISFVGHRTRWLCKITSPCKQSRRKSDSHEYYIFWTSKL